MEKCGGIRGRSPGGGPRRAVFGQMVPKGFYHMIRSKLVTVLAVVLMVLAVAGTSFALLNPQAVETISATRVKEYENKLFKENTLMEFNIVVDDADWQELIDNALSKEYIPVDVQINGETFKDVGIRAKGNTSLSGVSNDRYSFKVEFDHYIDGQTCYGLDKLALNNNYQDPTSMKEYLSYDMMRFLGVPSSLCSYAKVSVNGEYWGLYLAVECLEESYMERNYGSDYGNLYKPDTMKMGGGEKGGMQPPDNAEGGFRGPGAGAAGGENAGEVSIPDAAASASVNGGSPADNGGFAPPGGALDLPGEEAGSGGESVPSEQAGETGSGGETTAPDDNQGNNSFQSPSSNAPTDGGVQNSPPSENGQTEGEKNTNRGMGGFPGGMGGAGATSLTDQGDDIDSYSDIFDSAVFDITDSDKKNLIEAIQNLNAGTDLEKYVDVDEVLRYFAVNTVLVNLDSYASNMKHNYYLYEKDGQIAILPWDYNLAFGGFQAGSAESAVNFPIDTPVSGATLESSPLIGKLLEVDEYKEKYHEYLRQIVDGYFNSGYFEKTVDTINFLITEAVATDPNPFYSYDEYTAAVEMLKEFGKLRAESVEGQLDGTVPSTEEEQQANPDALIDASGIDMNTLGQQGGGGGFGGERGGRNSSNTAALPEAGENKGSTPPDDGQTAAAKVSGDTSAGEQGAPGGDNAGEQGAQAGERPGGEAVGDGEAPDIPTGGDNPFGGMPDMKLMREAMEIIGETEVSQLTDDQKAKLSDLGLSDEDLESFSTMQANLPQGGFGNRVPFGQETQNQTDWKLTALLLGISGILLIAGVIFALRFRRRR